MRDLKALLEEIFPNAWVEIAEDEDGITAKITGINAVERWDLDNVEEMGDYMVEAWSFDCAGDGELILYLVKLEGQE